MASKPTRGVGGKGQPLRIVFKDSDPDGNRRLTRPAEHTSSTTTTSSRLGNSPQTCLFTRQVRTTVRASSRACVSVGTACDRRAGRGRRRGRPVLLRVKWLGTGGILGHLRGGLAHHPAHTPRRPDDTATNSTSKSGCSCCCLLLQTYHKAARTLVRGIVEGMC